MAKAEPIRILHTDLLEHPAVQAWCELQSVHAEPEWIEILKERLPIRISGNKRFVYRLVGVAPVGSAVVGKRCRRKNAMIENAIYKEILPYLPIPALDYHGMVEEANGKFCWLFLEDAGEEAYSDLFDEHRALSAQWLGLMHTSAAHLSAPAGLPDKGPNHYLTRLKFARDAILGNLAGLTLHADVAPLKTIVSLCDELESRWKQVKALCEAAPPTLVHGDFVAKNLRVRSSQTGMVLLPFDWGEAGWGTPAIDIIYVDVPGYWSMIRDHWPWLNVNEIQRFALVGKIFRCLDAICWELPGFRFEGLQKAMNNMRIYESWLSDAMRSAGMKN